MSGKVIVITGGTGGIGFQAAKLLAGNKSNTIVVTGRTEESAQKAVATLKGETENVNIHYALADLSVQAEVTALAKDLLERFPKIDELINNAGNLSTGSKEVTVDGVDKNIAVNVIAPLVLTRALVPALKQANGRVQITSGGSPFDTLNVNDLDSTRLPVGLANYSHSKRIMECMVLTLSRELAPIPVNVVGGAVLAATNMTGAMSFSDVPWFMKLVYPLLKLFAFREDDGKSARKGAFPVIWAVEASPEELGTGRPWRAAPKKGKFKPEVASEENQAIVMKYVESKLVKT